MKAPAIRLVRAPKAGRLSPAVAGILAAFAAGQAQALPAGENITSGAASVERTSNSLTVNQATPRAVIDWQGFSVGASEAVRFNQPGANAIALNRVLGQDPSHILGALSANGQVFILNPNGVLFGGSAQVSVGGILASTLGMANEDFLAGRYVLVKSASGAGTVLNQGAIATPAGGYVALVSPRVANEGAIHSPQGSIALAAGDQVTLTLANGSLYGVAVNRGTLDALVANSGAIRAAGGSVILTASGMDQLARAVVNNTGLVETSSISARNGVIRLEGGEVLNAGTLAATSAALGGKVSVTGQTVELASGSVIDASGASGGGLIEIGGGWQGTGALPHARSVTIATGARLSANATVQGDGGTIAVWSGGSTRAAGSLQALGAGTGNGGRLETSGHLLDVTGITIDASAPRGSAGTWLLDPYDLTVSAAATTAAQAPAGTWESNAGGSTVRAGDIATALNAGTHVVLQTTGTPGDGTGNGDITVAAAIAKTAGGNASLTLKAAGSILVNAGISSTAGTLGVTLNSNTFESAGYVSVAAPIITNGGNIVIGGGATPLTGSALGTAAQASGVNLTAALSAGGGDISIHGTGRNSATNNNYGIFQRAAISTSGSGNITLNGTGGGTGNSEMGVISNANITAGTGNITITGAAGPAASFIGNHGVNLAGGTISTGGAGRITINGTATGSGTGVQSHGVMVQSGGSIRAADGLISITGDNHSIGSGIGNNGVYITGAGSTVRTSGSGGITMTGTGGGSGTSGSNRGVLWDAINAIESAGSGAISIAGTGGNAGGSGTLNYGVQANAALTAIGSNLTITGTGGGASGSGSGNTGVRISAAIAGAGGDISISGTGGNSRGTGNTGIEQIAVISNAAAGSITLNGTGGGNGIQEIGILSNADITAVTGNISMTGSASATAVGSGNHGVQVLGGTRSTTGSGTITISGTATGTGTGANASGVNVLSGAVINAADGPVSITGTNASTGTGTSNNGVSITGTGSAIGTSGSGGVSVTGSGGGSGAGSGNYGVVWDVANGVRAIGGGAITILGTGGNAGGSGSTNHGVYANAALAGNGGAILITGTGGNSRGPNNFGINLGGAITNTGTGSITLNGTGGGTGATSYGVNSFRSVTAAGGNISITGSGSAAGTGTGDHGINLTGSTISTTGAGAITLDGTATGTGGNTYGVALRNASVISAVNGLVSVTGTNRATGSGAGNDGVFAADAASTIRSTGTGGISVTGTPGGSGAGTGNGILVGALSAAAGTITLNSAGAVSTGALTAARMKLLGTGSHVLTNAGNRVGTLAANTGSVDYAQTGDLTIGTVDTTAGITAGGKVLVNVTGNLTLAGSGKVSGSGPGDALQLVSSGRFTNNAGAGALAVTGGGRWLVWTVTPGNDSRGGLAYGFKQYNARFGDTAADRTRNGVIYSVAPIVSVSINGPVKMYDGTDAATLTPANFVLDGALDGDTVTLTGGATGRYDTAQAGTGKQVSVTGLGLGAASNGAAAVYGYRLASSTVSGNTGVISAAPLVLVTASDQTKIYGDTLIFNGTEFSSAGLVNGETIGRVTLSSAGAPASAQVAGGPYAIVASDATGGTFSPGNYTIAYANGSLRVTPRPLTIAADDKARNEGAANPPLTARGAGFANGEGFGNLQGTLSLSTAALASSPGGSYAITPSGQSSTNYAITYRSGVLFIGAPIANPPEPPGQDPNLQVNAALAAALFEETCDDNAADGDSEALPAGSSDCIAPVAAPAIVRIAGPGIRLPDGLAPDDPQPVARRARVR
jgi:filamentous hemagglutinin family protein